MLTVLLFGVPLASAAESKTVLTQLPSDFVTAPWQRFQGENMFTAWEKQLLGKPAPAEGEESRPAVIKVMARARLPVRALLNTFLSEDPEEIAEWNPFAGEVVHLDKAIQLQTYRLPWPFASREYLVRCEDRAASKGTHQAHCSSVEAHPNAPLRPDRVRGKTETVWRFSEEKDGHTAIHLETLVDPKGALPKWLVDKSGRMAAVKIVRALIKHTSERYKQGLDKMKVAAAAAAAGGRGGGGGGSGGGEGFTGQQQRSNQSFFSNFWTIWGSWVQ